MIKVQEFKEPQHNVESERFSQPQKLYLPLSQHTGKPSVPCVKIGDSLEEGQVIANADGLISSNLHSPAGAKVINIDTWGHPVLKRGKCIVLQCEYKEKKYILRENAKNFEKDELLQIIKESGIVGMGGAAFPSHVKLNPPKKIDTLLINGCECEPYLAGDYRLMMENIKEIFQGIEIISKIINPDRIIFAIEENKREAVKQINYLINTKKFDLPETTPAVLKTSYPQGGEKQLIYSTTRRKVEGGKLPLDAGCLVHNVATCFAIYEAVYFNKPLIERLVSFCGDALLKPKNLWVKVGTTLRELFEKKVIEFKSEPKKIISGGPMMGVSLNSLDYPVTKGSGGFLFLKNNVIAPAESPCIRCARCVDACPMNLLPLEYAKRVKKEEFESLADFNIKDCIECGCCSYSCPAKIPIVHYIKTGKYYAPNNK